MAIGFDAFSQGDVPAYGEDVNPSGYHSSKSMGRTNAHTICVGIIIIGAVLLVMLGIIGLRISGEVVI
jgi:hypothetical protein